MNSLYRIFISAGVVFILIGIGLFFAQKFNIPMGKLPGDIVITKEKFSFYFPIATSIIISIVLSIIFYLFRR